MRSTESCLCEFILNIRKCIVRNTELASQPITTVVKPRFNGSLRDFQDLGNLLQRQVIDIVKGNHDSLGGRERGDCLLDEFRFSFCSTIYWGDCFLPLESQSAISSKDGSSADVYPGIRRVCRRDAATARAVPDRLDGEPVKAQKGIWAGRCFWSLQIARAVR
jgi:hypothetical protein